MYSVAELADLYPKAEERAKFAKLFALAQLFRYGIRQREFKITPVLDASIVLSPKGEQTLTRLRRDSIAKTDPVDRFAVFLKFGHRDLLVDLDATNGEVIENELTTILASGQLKYPWFFGRDLYDRAFEFNEIREALTEEQCSDLLSVGPGVFQIGEFLVGPLGLMRSPEKRILPPRRSLPLWHCSSPNCAGMHIALLPQLDTGIKDAFNRVSASLEREQGVESSWQGFFKTIIFNEQDSYYDDFRPVDLPWFLGNAFTEAERSNICSKLLDETTHLRAKLAENHRSLLRGNNEEIAHRLSKAQTLQLILMARDCEVIAAVDSCVDTGKIRIPLTEVRTSPIRFRFGTWADLHFQCSRLGLRIAGNSFAEPNARLKRLIHSIHTAEADAKQLSWRLRTIKGATIGEKIENLIAAETPAEILRKFAFVSEEKLKNTLAQIHAPHLYAAEFEEEALAKKILWRIGFEPSSFESDTSSLRNALREFREVAACPPIGDTWKERVRKIGVNLFVYLEDLLDRSLCFSSWIALGDHFVAQHQYVPNKAREIVSSDLSGVLTGKEGPITFDASGKNTLFTLISGFDALRIKCEAVLNDAPSKYERAPEETPHYDKKPHCKYSRTGIANSF